MPITLHLAEQRIGGEHLADVNAPTPTRPGATWAFWIFGFMVCVTVVAVFVIWNW